MRCPRCEHENPANLKFCGECGARLASVCPACGVSNAPAQKFCGECGASLSIPGAKSQTPNAYTPQHLAEKILTSKSALEGERKQITVLFADLKGSMELLADRDPEEARKLLDPVLEHMMEAVHRYEGTVNQVMGDGIMALFGAPVAHEDHAIRACYAALRMQDSVKRYAEDVRRTQGVTVQIRVGLNSGEVVVRAIGTDLHMDYTAVGQTTHLAARMEQLAEAGSILIAPDTLRLAEGWIRVRSLGPVIVKGIQAPIDVHELTGVGAARSGLRAAASHGLSRFVGRDAELDQVRRALDRARDGRGQVVTLVGEPGMGKSRLLHEVLHSDLSRGWTVLEAASLSYGATSFYLPIIQMLRRYFEIREGDGVGAVHEQVTANLLRLDESLQDTIPPILFLLEALPEPHPFRALDPSERRRQILIAIRRVLLRKTLVQPVLLVFEDLQWVDAETQTLLDAIVEATPAARLLFLATYRAEYRHGWGGKTYYASVHLSPLEAASSRQLADILLGTDPALEPLKQLLIERTQGNPLFLEETVKDLSERGSLAGGLGAVRPIAALGKMQVPATVQAVLAARIDRLDPEDKGILQVAAVIGNEVPIALLQRVADPGASLHESLRRLHATEFLYETAAFPETLYTFKHALTLEVAYGSLLHEQRRRLHQQVLAALEAVATEDGRESVETLARHAVRGEVWDRAARYLYQAGERALAYGAHTAAMPHYEASIAAVGRAGPAGDLGLKLDALLELWVTKIDSGQFRGLRSVAAEAETLAESLGDTARLARVRLLRSQALYTFARDRNQMQDAITRAREAIQLADPSDLRTAGYAEFIAARILSEVGVLHEALGAYDRGVALFQRREVPPDVVGLVYPTYASLCSWRAEILALLGEFRSARDSAETGLRLATAIKHPLTTSMGWALLGLVHLTRMEPQVSVSMFESGLAVAEEHEAMFGVLANTLGLALASALLGEADRTAALLKCAAATMPTPIPGLTKYGALPAAALLAIGRVDEALWHIDEGLILVDRLGARRYRPALLRLRGDAFVLTPALASAAVDSWQEARALAIELHMRPEEVLCDLSLGHFYGHAKDPLLARTHLARAAASARELDMASCATRAERELTAL